MILLAEAFPPGMPVGAHLGSMLHQVLIANRLERCQGCGAGDGIASKSGAVIPSDKHVRARSGEHGTDGYAACQAFRHGDDVWHDAVVFPTEELAGASHACLYLVADHYQVLLVAPLPHPLDELLGAWINAAFALHRLDQHTYRLLARSRLQSLQVIEGRLFEAICQGYPCRLVVRLPGCRSCSQGAAMEAALHADNLIRAVAMQPPVFTRQLDRSLVSLR